ncbi:MAG: hypothetical protein CVV39_04200 [Planctomycetes bacterium HGW-Planctomycetes-1]|nr:MAG: hypothetical protein CVV39_04200 [Planctomycetes bacterium HGW-Planctomycetes-1]
MLYKIFADLIVVIHFVWILFMLLGFVLTICSTWAVYILRNTADVWSAFFDRWIFRTVHLGGIIYVAVLTILGEYCPLTILENELKGRHSPELTYRGSFVIHYIEKLVYPEADFLIFVIPTMIIAAFSIVMFAVRPPAKIKQLIDRLF